MITRLPRNELVLKSREFFELVKENFRIGKEDVVYDGLKGLKLFLNSLHEHDRILAVEMICDSEFDRFLLEVIKAYRTYAFGILEEAIGVFESITIVNDVVIVKEISSRGFLPLFEDLLTSKEKKVVENVIWVFANVVYENEVFKDIYDQIGLIDKITQVYLIWSRKLDNVMDMTSAYIKLLSYYFGAKGWDSYPDIKPYIGVLIESYLEICGSSSTCSSDPMNPGSSLLSFISRCLFLTAQEDIDDLAAQGFWDEFLRKCIENLISTNLKIIEPSVQILANIAFSNDRTQLQVLLNSPFFTFIAQAFTQYCLELEKDILILINNIAPYGDDYTEYLVEKNILFLLLERFCKITYNRETINAYLSTIRTIFKNEFNMVLSNYIIKHMDTVDVIMQKIDLDENYANLELICLILKSMIDLAETYKQEYQIDSNLVIEYIRSNDHLVDKLELVQRHKDLEVYNLYIDLARNYFYTE